jgi:hypothetical protein
VTPDFTEAVERINASEIRWESVTGLTRWWRRQDLVETAYDRRLARLAGRGWVSRSIVAESALPRDSYYETVLRLYVLRNPYKLRAELVTHVGAEAKTDLLVVDGLTFWDRVGDTVRTNDGNPNHRHGGGDIARLLWPAAALKLFDLAPAGEEEVAGRSCTVLFASARPEADEALDDLPFNMIAGGSDFRFSVDDERGVFVRVVKVVDGFDTEVNEFLSIDFDQALPEELFAPLP